MEIDSLVRRLREPSPYGDAIQKCCDAVDWADPRLLLAVREGLGTRPRVHARQWEGAAALIALADAGKLQAGARGIAFGSGREPLTFAVGSRVGHLTATDLYEAGTAWDTARTADPLGFVLGAAPAGFPRNRLAVHHMDMREIGYPDASFDFAYSISSVEHIGDDADFLRHFREVRRVLKPDGLYAVTTEVLFGPASRRTRGNYAFAVHHLLRLIAEAGLQAAPMLDMRLSDLSENDPRTLALSRHADPAEPLIQELTVRDLGGIASAPVTLLLRPAIGTPVPVTVIGLEDRHARIEQARVAERTARYSDWVRLNPWGAAKGGAEACLDLWADKPVAPGTRVLRTNFLDLGTSPMEVQLVAVPSPAHVAPARLDYRVLSWEPLEGKPKVETTSTMAFNTAAGAAGVARFTFAPQAGLVYAFAAQLQDAAALFSSIDLQLRRAPR